MKKILFGLAAGAALIGAGLGANYVTASDHDDGTTDVKTQNTNLTDLYVFTETTENALATPGDLIFIMNTNPRSLARQQYYFNTRARYEFHVGRVSNNDNVPAGQQDVLLRFEFTAPDAAMKQKMTVTAIRDGVTTSTATTVAAGNILTTPLNDAPNNNNITLAGIPLTVYAGLREDPFFFDVEQYFRVRASAAAGALGTVPFRNPGFDFTAGYNVLSIVVRVPKALLQGSSTATSFDVWETISVQQ
jgi:hypothetical protein